MHLWNLTVTCDTRTTSGTLEVRGQLKYIDLLLRCLGCRSGASGEVQQMGKIDKKRLRLLIKAIEDKCGKGTIFTLGDKEDIDIPRVRTGIEDLDFIMGGGVPEGRIIEIYGPEAVGKTSLAYHMLAQYPLGLYIAIEGTFSADRARLFGNRKGQLLVRRPEWGEQAIGMVIDFAEAGCPLIVVDSVPALIPKKEFMEDDMEKSPEVAAVARLLSRKLPKIAAVCESTGSTVVFINQVRDNIGVLWGDPYSTPGGRALKHFASIRMQVGRKQWLEVAGERLGLVMKLKVVKSKVCAPFRECEIPLVFDVGFVAHDNLKAVLKEVRTQHVNQGTVAKKSYGRDGAE